MKNLTNEELLEEIRRRFESDHNALNDMRALTRKLEQMNEKLQESEALKSQFLSNIRNEINNPLTVIMGLAGQFFSGECDPDTCKRTIRTIYSEAFNLDYQLQNIFLAAELEAGEAEPSYALVSIGAVVASCLDKLKYRIEDKAIKVSTVLPEDLIFPTDAQKMEAVLINLLGNAVEFTEGGGEIGVEFQENKSGLVMSVWDNGKGINPTDREKIFDRFKQLEAGTKKGHRGHGLGLSICWTLAELLNGEIALESAPADGCRFTLTLPRPEEDIVVHAMEGNFFLFDGNEDQDDFETF
jgi:signal transduction histidine kinase